SRRGRLDDTELTKIAKTSQAGPEQPGGSGRLAERAIHRPLGESDHNGVPSPRMNLGRSSRRTRPVFASTRSNEPLGVAMTSDLPSAVHDGRPAGSGARRSVR